VTDLVTVVLEGAAKPDDPVVSPGLAGFLVTFAIALATLFLIKSMVKHLRKVRYGPGPAQSGPAQSGPAQSGPAQSGPSQSGEVPQPRTRTEDGDPKGGDSAGASEHS
jgi:hypothetical protein